MIQKKQERGKKMKKIKYIVLTLVSLLMLTGFKARAEGLPQYDLNSVIVITKSESDIYSLSLMSQTEKKSMDSVLRDLGITEKKELMSLTDENDISLFSADNRGESEIIELTLPEGGEDKVWEAINALNASGTVETAEPNYYYYLDSVPNDTYYNVSSSYNYQLIKTEAQRVWDLDIDCSDVNVAVLDSGILSAHEDLADNISQTLPGYDFAEGDSDPDDTYNSAHAGDSGFVQGHGTHVSGIVSAVTNNGKGVASLAGGTTNHAAKIVSLKIFKDYLNSQTNTMSKTTSESYILSAINYIKKNNIPIASCSWGGSYSSAVALAIKNCKNTLFVFAAGNAGKSNDSGNDIVYPASLGYDNVISVGASTAMDTLAQFSNYGDSVNLAAPGAAIYSTHNTYLSTSYYKFMSGTSQATPLVASCAAVIKGACPTITPKNIKKAILNGSDTVSTLTYTSGGTTRTVNGNRRLNAYGALMSATGGIYNIKWENYDGTVLDETTVIGNEVPVYGGDTPQRPSTVGYDYVFSGWSPTVGSVTEDTVYTAVYTAVKKDADTVTLSSLDDNITVEKTVTDTGDALITVDGADDREIYAYLVTYDENGTIGLVDRYDFVLSRTVIEKRDNGDMRLYIWTADMIPIIEPLDNLNDFWTKTSQ